MDYLSRIKQQSLINQLAFYALLASGAYIIFLWSPNVLGNYFSRWTKIIIYLIPWLMFCLAYSWQVLTNKDHRLEIILIASIIILGIVNTFLSDAVSKSLAPMRTFLLTGIFALWSSMFLLTDQPRRLVFDSFCAGALVIVASVEIIVWLVRGADGPRVFQILTLHPIPLGTLIILLSPGPVCLMVSKNPKIKLLGGLLVLLGGLLIFLTHKRGTWIAVAAMLALGLIYLARRQKYLILFIILVITLMLPLQAQRRFARLDPHTPHYVSILDRLELYNFALHIWKTHPIMGIGLRSSTHSQYLNDYQLYNEKLHDFPHAVAKLQTFDNMLLTALVEMGSLMTVLYGGLVLYILVTYCLKLWSWPKSSTLEWYRVLVLLGFAIHSLSYDSLLLPSVNWLFHVQLGIMAGFQVSGTAPR
jgi:hypothetical protein